MSNYTLIDDTDPNAIVERLQEQNINRGHFVNGIFGAPQEIVLPMQAAWFKGLDNLSKLTNTFNHVVAKVTKSPAQDYAGMVQNDDAIIIAVNSDLSVNRINADKSADGVKPIPDQYKRADQIAAPLAEMFPNRKVVVVFYDEKEPAQSRTQSDLGLYDALNEKMPNLLQTLMKGGWGTSAKEGEIVGRNLFRFTFGIPLPHDTAHLAPYCAGQNAMTPGPQQDSVNVTRLTSMNNIFGRQMMTEANKALFKLPDSVAHLSESFGKRFEATIAPFSRMMPAMK